MDRVDTGRTGCSPDPLPSEPVVQWQQRAPGPFTVAPIADVEGAILVASARGALTRIDAHGALDWQADLGAPAASAPAILSDLGVVVVTRAGEAVAFAATGQRRWATRLPSSSETAPAPLPRSDGSLVVAVDYTLVRLDPTGDIRLQAAAPELPVALLGDGERTLVVEHSGRVQVWTPDGRLETVGTLGGSLRADPVLAGEQLIAPVGDGTLTGLELRTGRRSERWPGSTARVLAAPAVVPSGKVVAVDSEGVLLIEPAPAREPLEVPLTASRARGAVTTAPRPSSAWLAPLVDARGTAIVVAPGLEFAVVHAGRMRPVEGTGCNTPVAVVPAGPRRAVVACGSGLVVSLTERTAAPSP
jgi:outer membrane protein assembly factor BamB